MGPPPLPELQPAAPKTLAGSPLRSPPHTSITQDPPLSSRQLLQRQRSCNLWREKEPQVQRLASLDVSQPRAWDYPLDVPDEETSHRQGAEAAGSRRRALEGRRGDSGSQRPAWMATRITPRQGPPVLVRIRTTPGQRAKRVRRRPRLPGHGRIPQAVATTRVMGERGAAGDSAILSDPAVVGFISSPVSFRRCLCTFSWEYSASCSR